MICLKITFRCRLDSILVLPVSLKSVDELSHISIISPWNSDSLADADAPLDGSERCSQEQEGGVQALLVMRCRLVCRWDHHRHER